MPDQPTLPSDSTGPGGPTGPAGPAGSAGYDDQELQQLFAQRLPDEALPAATLDRVLHAVLLEVQQAGLAAGAATSPITQPVPQPAGRAAPPPAAAPGLLERIRNWLGGLRPTQALGLAAAGALALMLVFAGVSRLTPRPISATADVLGGDATVLRGHNNSYRIYRDGDKLKMAQGDQVLTRDGSMQLSLFPNQLATIEPGANVEVVKLDDANGGTQVTLFVHNGVLHNDIDESLGPNDEYLVLAPGGLTVAAHGTDFTVEAISEAETLVTTIKGEVEVSLAGSQVEVGAGEEVDAVIGKALEVVAADHEHSGELEPVLIVAAAEDGLRLFALPSEQAAEVGKLLAGKAIRIEAQDPSGEWYKVCCIAGQSGWVRVPLAKPAD